MMDAIVQTVDIITMEEYNMRLCTIVFPESSSQRKKEYTFKIPNMSYVREGDILRNSNYQNDPMKIVRIFDYPVGVYNTYNGFILKELLPIDTIVEVRNWYNGQNQTLRRLALQAYTEKELNEPQNFKEVLKALGVKSLDLNIKLAGEDASSTRKLPKKTDIEEIGRTLTLHMKLALIAKYFNSAWRPSMDKTKYFLARTPYSYDVPNSTKLDNGYYVGIHERVMYPGIVYFQNQEDVRKAYEMLKDELR